MHGPLAAGGERQWRAEKKCCGGVAESLAGMQPRDEPSADIADVIQREAQCDNPVKGVLQDLVTALLRAETVRGSMDRANGGASQ